MREELIYSKLVFIQDYVNNRVRQDVERGESLKDLVIEALEAWKIIEEESPNGQTP